MYGDVFNYSKICPNEKCNAQICYDCMKTQYFIPDNYKGLIKKSKLVCDYCTSLINPLVLKYALPNNTTVLINTLYYGIH